MSLIALLLGIGLGITNVVAVTQLLLEFEPRFSKFWCRGPRGTRQKGFMRRIQWALSPSPWPELAPLLLAVLNPLHVFVAYEGTPRSLVLGSMVGIVLAIAVGHPLKLGKNLKTFRQRVASAAVRMLSKVGDNDFAESLLLRTATSADPMMRMVAAEGLRRLGTPAGNAALEKLCGDRDMKVSTAACYAYADLLRVLSGKEVQSLAPMAQLIDEFKIADQFITRNRIPDAAEFFKRRQSAEYAIDKLLHSQLRLRRAFPHIYCRECRRFGEMQAFQDWRWVRCPQCQDAPQLVPGVERVVGQIGGRSEWTLENGVLRLSLWDADDHKVRLAEMDTVEIVGGREMDYDWAVSAVVEALRNQRGQSAPPLALAIVHSPPLSQNSQRLLQQFGFASKS